MAVDYYHPPLTSLFWKNYKKFKPTEKGLTDFYKAVNLKKHPWRQTYYYTTLRRFKLSSDYRYDKPRNKKYWNTRSIKELQLIKVDIAEMEERKKANTLTSYKPILKKLISEISPKEILEWGPGESTKFMIEHTSDDCNIHCIEHDSWWYSLWKRKWDVRFVSNPPVFINQDATYT